MRAAGRDWRRRGSTVAAVLAAASIAVAATVAQAADEPAEPAEPAESAESGDGPLYVDPASSGQPYGDVVPGVLTFRGNPTRSYYGTGPIADHPRVLWSYPEEGGLCSISVVEQAQHGGIRKWCGTGWTGQPAVFERDGRTWVAVGTYDQQVHFLDAETGEQVLDPYRTRDLIKGSVTVDPDGYPLLYTGSRDNYLHVVALDRDEPTALWRLWSYDSPELLWNDDWDPSPLIVGDYLVTGGENGRWYVVKLNRSYAADGKVTVDPEVVVDLPGWDEKLLADLDGFIFPTMVSIEDSVAMSGSVVYFDNGGGLVQGWDLAAVPGGGEPERVFRFWTGDDGDPSPVIDEDGFIYKGVEYKRQTPRSHEVGQLIKLDPSKPDDPLVWSVPVRQYVEDGVWATPAIYQDLVLAPTDDGRLLGIDRADGTIRWSKRLAEPLWSSPVVVDGVLVQGDCRGVLHGFDLSDTSLEPKEIWQVQLDGCIESTPAVWEGRMYVGARGGKFYSIG